MTTPRESFQVSGHSTDFSKMAVSEHFLVACDYAILQLLTEMWPNTQPGMPTDPYVGIDANAKMHGARRVLEILKSLHEPVKPPTQPKKETLHYA